MTTKILDNKDLHFRNYIVMAFSKEKRDFLLRDPRTLQLILKPREAQRIIDFDTFWKGFRRVLEGVLQGPSADPLKNPSETHSETPSETPSETLLKAFWGPGAL